MSDFGLPDTLLEKAQAMEHLLVARATGDITASTKDYEALRREMMANATLKPLLPDFVRTCRSLDVFWPFIKNKAGSYAERRQIIGTAFTPLMDHLEGGNRAPADAVISDQLAKYDSEGVRAIWEKALSRRANDPEGAITVARTLLETICKNILDAAGVPYSDKEDLPKLYGMTAKTLNLAPEQHALDAIKAPRHASLAVNLAGALATFLIETHLQVGREGDSNEQ